MNICILARKRLFRNTRIVRQARTLADKGHSVTVVCLEAPCPELQALAPDAVFHVVTVEPLLSKIMPKVNRVVRLPRILASSAKRSVLRAGVRVIRMAFQTTASAIRRLAGLFSALGVALEQMRMLRQPAEAPEATAPDKKIKGRWILRLAINVARVISLRCQQLVNTASRLLMRTTNSVTRALIRFENRHSRAAAVATNQADWKDLSTISLTLRHPLHMLVLRPLALIVLLPFNPGALRRIKWSMMDVEILRLFLGPYFNLANSYDFTAKAEALLGERGFDVYQAHDSHALVAAEKFSRRHKAAFIYDILEISVERSGPAAAGRPTLLCWAEDRLEKHLVRRATGTLCVGPAVAEHSAEHFKIMTPAVVRNCCLYHPEYDNQDIRRDLGLAEGDRLCLVIGAIYANQGIEQLIEALPLCDASIHVVAMGPVAQEDIVPELRAMAQEQGVANRFHILPPSPPQDLIAYASGADAGVISRQATCLNNLYSLPNKIFEMLMARLPVLSGRLPNIQMIIEEFGVGAVFDQENPTDIARCLNAFFDDKATLAAVRGNVRKAVEVLCWEKERLRYIKVMNTFMLRHAKKAKEE